MRGEREGEGALNAQFCQVPFVQEEQEEEDALNVQFC